MVPEANADPLLGSLLDGRYQIVELLGKGGMGNVYLVNETRLRRRCALKVLHPRFAAERTYVERFLREAQTIAQFEHRNIVDIYSYGEEPSGEVFFAMELLTGEDLDARVKARAERPYTSQDCCLWGVQIARAMAVVHDAGLIHRDLKTSNIFLARRRDGEEIIKLLDFGIARPEEGSELTATGVALGTPSYMSPEQVRNVVVDRRSDIYSFGVLLFKLLTGRLPFTGDAIQMAMGHCLAPVPTPSVVAPEAGISPELDAIVMRAMAKEPGDRHASMRELEEALAAVLRAEAPELVTVIKRARTLPPTRPEPDARTLAPQLAADAGTPAPAAQSTGPTTAMAVREPRGGRRALFIGGAAVFAAALVFVVKGFAGPGEAAPEVAKVAEPVVSTPAPDIVAPPVVEAAEATPTAKIDPTPVEAPAVEPTPPQADPPAPEPTPEPTPPEPAAVDRRKKVEPTPTDPFKQVERRAAACRRKLKAVDGPKISVDYAVGIDGKVTRSIPSVTDPLGQCLAQAVQQTQFAPKLVLGKKLSL